jgi:non-ribosomal peptide synthetase component E (peptide arylation enzyme)
VLIGYPHPEVPSADGLCAVLVADGTPPNLEEINNYLDELGMTWHNWPDRVEVRDQLPKNALGKVERGVLREELEKPAGEPG